MAANLNPLPEEEFDLIIIGAGPAGLSTGLALSRLRPNTLERTLILEKEHFPRRKLCGGGLTRDAETLLEKLGLDVTEIPSIPSPEIQLRFHKFTFSYRTPPSALRVVDRMTFDNWMLRKALDAGVRIRFGEKVVKVERTDEKAVVTAENARYRAKYVIVANGSRSTLLQPNSARNKAKLIEVVLHKQQHHFTAPLFDLSAKSDGFNGYYWAFPSITNGERTLNIGLYDANLSKRWKPRGAIESLRAWATQFGLTFENDQVAGAPINLLFGKPVAEDGQISYIGDAVGTEALLGEGISFAIGSGVLAAKYFSSAKIRAEYPSFQNYFERSPLRRSLYLRSIFARIFYFFYWDWTTATLWRVFHPLINLITRYWLLGWASKIELDVQK